MAAERVSKSSFAPGFPGRMAPRAWLNLVCLDAPLVAVSWQWLFARTLRVELSLADHAALVLTAWVIYLADRLADTFALDLQAPISLRHGFCLRHRRAWMIALPLLAALDTWIIWQHLDPAVLRVGGMIGALAGVYLVLNYAASGVWRILPVKEAAIGFLFALGTLVALLARVDEYSLGWMVLLFGTLCTLNCISIAVWERVLDEAQGRDSIATRWPDLAKGVGFLALLLALGASVFGWREPNFAPITLCLALSAVLLAALEFGGRRLPVEERTALADLVLLTPLFALAIS